MVTGIEWTDATWNPVVGCSKVSAGCTNCYAEGIDRRFRGAEFKPWHAGNAAYNVRLHPERLSAPLHWRKPRRVFVNSMSDLFHELVPFEFIDRVFAVMALSPQHTFQVLTKRPERMREYLRNAGYRGEMVGFEIERLSGLDRFNDDYTDHRFPLPLPNVWLGTSVEDQAAADERIPELLATPAAVRFLSVEPLLGPVDLNAPQEPWGAEDEEWPRPLWGCLKCGGSGYFEPRNSIWCDACRGRRKGIDWVIVGGESGPGARPCDLAWVRAVVGQCRAAGVACFVKQLGSAARSETDRLIGALGSAEGMPYGFYRKLWSAKGGDPSEWPEDLRVREWPA